MYKVYLAGEIHSNWRDQIIEGAKGLAIEFFTPESDHATSDDIGKNAIGDQGSNFHNDNISAKINSIRNQTNLTNADIVVVKFGEKYKQWNAAFDAGYATALGKKVIVIHPEEFIHALKEVDAFAAATVKSESQVVEILKHIVR